MKEKNLYVITIIAILIMGVFYCYQYKNDFSDESEKVFYMPKDVGASVKFTGNNQKIFTEVGQHIQKKLISNGNKGSLVFGPYIDIDEGCYNIVFVYNVLEYKQISNAYVDISTNNGSNVIVKKELDLNKNEISLDNIEFNKDRSVEFRLFVDDGTVISFDKIIISKIK